MNNRRRTTFRVFGGSWVSPLILFVLALFSFFIAPRFKKIFADFDVSMPWHAKIVVDQYLSCVALFTAAILFVLYVLTQKKWISLLSIALIWIFLFWFILGLHAPMIKMIEELIPNN